MFNSIKPNKAKSPYEMRAKVLQDNSALLKKEKENEPDEFIVGLGLEQGNKRPGINKGIAAKRPEEEVFFKDEDFRYRDEDEKDEKWQNDFGKALMEEASGLGERVNNQVTQNQSRGKVANGYNGNNPDYTYDKSDPLGIMYRYTDMKDYYETEGENAYENVVKGMVNNFRSAIGGSVEDLAYFIRDYFPNYKPAQNVLDRNTAGKIEEMAQKQFGSAKETTGDVGDRFIDAADNFSHNMGYNVFGFNAGNYFQSAGESFDEYRRLRELGYSKEEASAEASKNAVYAVLSTKVDDYIGRSNVVDERLFGKNGIVDKSLNSNGNSGIVITDKQFGKKIGKHTKEYGLNPGNANDRIEMERIINDIIDNSDEIIEGRWKGQEGTILFFRKGEDLVLVRKNDNNFVSIFKGGANNGWFKDLRK